jgi:hypothetical protein
MTWRFARKAEGQGQACDLCDSFFLLPQVEPRDILLIRNRKNRRRKGKIESSMKKTKGGFRTFAPYLLLCIVVAETTVLAQRAPRSFPVEETTIAQIHTAMRERRLTCRALVDAYLKRIDAYDKRGPAINALVVLNPNATKEADELDRRFAQGGLTGPLHCIPAIVKDNFVNKSGVRPAILRFSINVIADQPINAAASTSRA